jgi:hypothetical protein
MFDVVNFTAGLFSGGFLGALGAIMVKEIHINRLEADILIFDRLLYDAQKKLRKLTERDSKGRFTGGK